MDDIWILDDGPPLVFYIRDNDGDVIVDRSIVYENPEWYTFIEDVVTETEHRLYFQLNAADP